MMEAQRAPARTLGTSEPGRVAMNSGPSRRGLTIVRLMPYLFIPMLFGPAFCAKASGLLGSESEPWSMPLWATFLLGLVWATTYAAYPMAMALLALLPWPSNAVPMARHFLAGLGAWLILSVVLFRASNL